MEITTIVNPAIIPYRYWLLGTLLWSLIPVAILLIIPVRVTPKNWRIQHIIGAIVGGETIQYGLSLIGLWFRSLNATRTNGCYIPDSCQTNYATLNIGDNATNIGYTAGFGWLLLGLIIVVAGYILWAAIGGIKTTKDKQLEQRLAAQRAEIQAACIPEGQRPAFDQWAAKLGVTKATGDGKQWLGWKMVEQDTPGTTNPLTLAARNTNLDSIRTQGRLYGQPGIGLDSSGFETRHIESGMEGEQLLAKAVARVCPRIIGFYSLYGMDSQGNQTTADIDAVLVGIDSQYTVHAWYVDVKNYKGGDDTTYWPYPWPDDRKRSQMVAVSASQHAFVESYSGSPLRALSGNMAWQRANFHANDEYLALDIQDEWVTCLVAAGDNGEPQIAPGLEWTGGIRALSLVPLLTEIKAMDLQPASAVPQHVVDWFANRLKPTGQQPQRQQKTRQ